MLPLRGVSMLDVEGGPFHDPEADDALFAALKEHVGPGVEVVEIDAHINDPAFSEALARRLLALLPSVDPEP